MGDKSFPKVCPEAVAVSFFCRARNNGADLGRLFEPWETSVVTKGCEKADLDCQQPVASWQSRKCERVDNRGCVCGTLDGWKLEASAVSTDAYDFTLSGGGFVNWSVVGSVSDCSCCGQSDPLISKQRLVVTSGRHRLWFRPRGSSVADDELSSRHSVGIS